MTIKVIATATAPNGAAKPSYCACLIDDWQGNAPTPVKK
jgi:hypothetical protein